MGLSGQGWWGRGGGTNLWTAAIEGTLGVKVGDGAAGDVHADQGPVDLQVDGDQQQILLEDVHLRRGRGRSGNERERERESG